MRCGERRGGAIKKVVWSMVNYSFFFVAFDLFCSIHKSTVNKGSIMKTKFQD